MFILLLVSALYLATSSLIIKMRISRCTYVCMHMRYKCCGAQAEPFVMQCLRSEKSHRNMKKMIEAFKRECAALAFGLEMRAVTTALMRRDVRPLPKALSLSRQFGSRCYPCKVFELFFLMYPCQSSKSHFPHYKL